MSLTNNHFKTFLISLLSLTLLFSISCSDAYKPSGEDGKKNGTRTLSYYAGDWWGSMAEGSEEQKIITINADGSVTTTVGGDGELPSTKITKNSDTSYTCYEESLTIQFDFSSDTTGTLTLTQEETSMTIDITKR